MKYLSYLSLIAVAGIAGGNAHAFEMRRISVSGGTLHRCIVTDDKLIQETVLDGITTDVKSDLTTDAAAINKLVSQVPTGFRDAVPEPGDDYVNWWVRNDGERDFRMVRSYVPFPDGSHQALQEPSQASKKLAEILGTICGFGPQV